MAAKAALEDIVNMSEDLHDRIVAWYSEKLAEAMEASVSGFDDAIAAAKKAIGK